jgi:hypothetical protein
LLRLRAERIPPVLATPAKVAETALATAGDPVCWLAETSQGNRIPIESAV